MTVYLDASALIKRYVDEADSALVHAAMDGAGSWVCCRIGFVETLRQIRAHADAATVRAARNDWAFIEVVDVDQALCERAVEQSIKHGLRTLDALHLAAGLAVSHETLTFATFDHRLHAAAAAEGLATLPASLS